MPELANVLQLVSGDAVSKDWPELPLRMLTGRCAVWMHQPKESEGGIILPISGRMRPDVGYLATDAMVGEYGLKAGSIVAVAPYRGDWLDHEGHEYRVFGRNEGIEDAILMYWDGEWKAAPWVHLIEREKFESVIDVDGFVRGSGFIDGEKVLFNDPIYSHEGDPECFEIPGTGQVIAREIFVYA